MSPAPAKPPARHDGYHHGDLRRALLAASLALIEEGAPEGLTLREVARRAGVSHAAPYRHFRDKEALLAAVAEEGFIALRRSVERAAAGAPDLIGQLKQSALAYVRFAQRRPTHFRVMFARDLADDSHPAPGRVADELFDQMIALIEEGQARGLVRPGDARLLARVAWATVHGVAHLALSGQFVLQRRREVQEIAEGALDCLLDGLRPRAPARRGTGRRAGSAAAHGRRGM